MGKVGNILNGQEVREVLAVLVASPHIFSYLEADIAHELEDAGLFELEHCQVTDAGHALLADSSRLEP